MNPAGARQLTKFPARRVKKRSRTAPPTRRGVVVFAESLLILGGFGCSGRTCGEASSTPAREDPAAAEIARSIPAEHVAYVTNSGSDSLSLIDLEAPGRTRQLALDFDARREAPHHLAVDVARDRLYLAFSHPRENAFSASHRDHGRAANTPGELITLQLSTLRLLGRADTDESPGDIVLGADGNTLLISHYDLARAFAGAARAAPPRELYATLQRWDAASGTKRAERAICVAPHGIAIRRDGSTALLACYGSDELALVDLRSAELPTEKIPLGAAPGPLGAPRFGPYSVTLAPDERFAVVAELEGKALRTFDLAARRFDETRRIELGARAMMPCFAPSGILYVPLAAPDGIAAVDTEHATILRRAELDASCTTPHVTGCRRDGRVFVVCEGNHVDPGALLELDPESLSTRARWPLGVFPDAIVFSQ